MNNKKKEWEKWLNDLKGKGYSKDNIKNTLRERGYNEREISEVLKLEDTKQKRTIYLILFIFVLVVSAFFLISYMQKQTTPRVIQTPQEIFTDVMFSNITADRISVEEITLLLKELETTFNTQCLGVNSVPSYTCFPFVIYSYIETKKQIGVSQEDVHTELSSKILSLWKDYYKNAEFNKEGFITGEPSFALNSIVQYYYFIALMPESEKEFWFEKVSEVSPTDINMRYHLLKIYWDCFNASMLSPTTNSVITLEGMENLCYINRSIEKDWSVCRVLKYLQIKEFCEIEVTSQEISLAQQKLEIETQDRTLQICKEQLQKRIS